MKETHPLSIVIPCWNDARALRSLFSQLRGLRGASNVIVADASPGEACQTAAAEFGAHFVKCPHANRGSQMNAGARVAASKVLLFQHADTELTQAHLDALHTALQDPDLIGGAFHRKFDRRHAWLQWLEPLGRYLGGRGGTLYGDQSIFVRTKTFQQLGGFAEIPLMEDMEFSKRLRASGRTALLDPPISSSPRHHQSRGAILTSIRNGALILLYRYGVSPTTLHRWYYRGRSPETFTPPRSKSEPYVANAASPTVGASTEGA